MTDSTLAPIAEAQVCLDCTYSRESGEEALEAVEIPWNLLEGADVTLNLYDEDSEEAEAGFADYSTRPCDGCGSRLAGSRYRYAIWAY
jgi:hypothetical protein